MFETAPFSSEDVCPLLVLMVALWLAGKKLVSERPELRRWGTHLAVAAAVVYAVFLLLDAAGTGRGYSPWTDGVPRAGDLDGSVLCMVGLRSLVVGGLSLGLSWIGLSLAAFVYGHTLGLLLRHVRSLAAKAGRRMRERQERRAAERDRVRQAELDRLQAPERERVRLQAEARTKEQADSQRRRENARVRCELLYSLHEHEIAERFPRERLQAFLGKYLSDTLSPESVEERSQQLQAIIEQHRDKVAPPKKKTSLAELAQWFLREKAQIDNSALDAVDKEVLILHLNGRYAKLQEKHMRSIEP